MLHMHIACCISLRCNCIEFLPSFYISVRDFMESNILAVFMWGSFICGRGFPPRESIPALIGCGAGFHTNGDIFVHRVHAS